MQNTTYSPVEIAILKSVLKPANETLYEVVKRAAGYKYMQLLAVTELGRDGPRYMRLLDQLEDEVEASAGQHPQSLFFSLNQIRVNPDGSSPSVSCEDEVDYGKVQEALKIADDYLQRSEPQDFDDWFWQWFYGLNAYLICHNQLIAPALGQDKRSLYVYSKFTGYIQPCSTGQVLFPKLDELPVVEAPSVERGMPATVIRNSKANRYLPKIFRRKEDPYAKVSHEQAVDIMRRSDQLAKCTFGMAESSKTRQTDTTLGSESEHLELFQWKVVAIEFVRGEYRYGIGYCDIPGSQVTFSKEETLSMIKSSVLLVA